MSLDTSPSLLEQIRDATHPLAWDEFMRRYWPVVYAFARKRGCTDATAQDVVQDVMVRIFEDRSHFRYNPERGRFRDWLGALVRNRVADYRRSHTARKREELPERAFTSLRDDAEAPDEEWERSFEQALLLAILGVACLESSPREYLAFELTTLSDLTPAQTASITGLSRNAVYKARRRVVARIKELAGDYASEGVLTEQVKKALALMPDARTERDVTSRIRESLQER